MYDRRLKSNQSETDDATVLNLAMMMGSFMARALLYTCILKGAFMA
jgi:hypothetical protein